MSMTAMAATVADGQIDYYLAGLRRHGHAPALLAKRPLDCSVGVEEAQPSFVA